MVTNLSNLSSAESFYDIVVFTNQVTNNFMGMLFIIIVFVILFSMFIKKYELNQSLLVSSFMCFGLSIMLTAIELLEFWFIIMFFVIVAFCGFIEVIYNKNY